MAKKSKLLPVKIIEEKESGTSADSFKVWLKDTEKGGAYLDSLNKYFLGSTDGEIKLTSEDELAQKARQTIVAQLPTQQEKQEAMKKEEELSVKPETGLAAQFSDLVADSRPETRLNSEEGKSKIAENRPGGKTRDKNPG